MKIKSKRFPQQIGSVHRQLKVWRQHRKSRDGIPETLWRAMARLAQTYGVSRVSRTLGVEYYGLKRRVEEGPRAQRNGEAVTFVEVKGSAPVEPCGGVIELENGSGAKLTLRLAPSSPAEVLGWVQALWRRGA